MSKHLVTGECLIDTKDITNHLAQASEKSKEQERKANESLVLHMGPHTGCGGEVDYHSSFVLDVPRSEVRIGGDNPTREVVKCSCTRCGVMFDPYFEPYRKQIEKYRQRK